MLKLSVMIPCRDRLILTKKCIDSIWKNSSIFNKIDIYVFDNNSDLNTERLSLFYNLLEDKKICHYSYDTPTSLHNCFGKATTFMRWCKTMQVDYEVRHMVKDHESRFDNFYLLLDNDFILCENWGEYFISACKRMREVEKDMHYLVPFPGGIPERFRGKDKPTHSVDNIFHTDKKFEVIFANGGGSSGFWFSDLQGIKKLQWGIDSLAKTYNRSKRHDSETWNMIKRKSGNINYVGCVIPPKEQYFALHLGGQFGSLCNRLTHNDYSDKIKNEIANSELVIKDMSVNEIIEKYKDLCNSW